MPTAKTPKVSPLRGMSVEDWVARKVQGWQATVVERLLAICRRAAPTATPAIKWGQPVVEENGPVAFIKVAKAHVTFGFWRGADLDDKRGLLEGGERMKHVKIAASDALDEKQIAAWLRQAVALNRKKGNSTRR